MSVVCQVEIRRAGSWGMPRPRKRITLASQLHMTYTKAQSTDTINGLRMIRPHSTPVALTRYEEGRVVIASARETEHKIRHMMNETGKVRRDRGRQQPYRFAVLCGYRQCASHGCRGCQTASDNGQRKPRSRVEAQAANCHCSCIVIALQHCSCVSICARFSFCVIVHSHRNSKQAFQGRFGGNQSVWVLFFFTQHKRGKGFYQRGRFCRTKIKKIT
jgi:hypothetical protein